MYYFYLLLNTIQELQLQIENYNDRQQSLKNIYIVSFFHVYGSTGFDYYFMPILRTQIKLPQQKIFLPILVCYFLQTEVYNHSLISLFKKHLLFIKISICRIFFSVMKQKACLELESQAWLTRKKLTAAENFDNHFLLTISFCCMLSRGRYCKSLCSYFRFNRRKLHKNVETYKVAV